MNPDEQFREQARQQALLSKALAGLANMGTLALFAWTVGGLIAVFTR
jgi:hypothetical protein